MRMDIGALRAQTPGCAGRIHLNNAGAALMSQPTLDAMTGQLRREAQIGGYEAADEAQDAVAAVYAAVAELVGGHSDEIALFDNATHAWNAAFYSARLRPGDQILTGRAEYGSNVLAYWQAARRAGAEVVVVPDDEHGQLDVAALERVAGPRTALIGVSHVPTSGGLVQPAAEIGRIARGAITWRPLAEDRTIVQLVIQRPRSGSPPRAVRGLHRIFTQRARLVGPWLSARPDGAEPEKQAG